MKKALHPQSELYLELISKLPNAVQALISSSAAGAHPAIAARDLSSLVQNLGAGAPPVVERVSSVLTNADGSGVPLKIFLPFAARPLPVLLFVHGGGWVGGSLEGYDTAARRMCALTGAAVVSVGYRLAPEHIFPAGLEDVITAMRWVSANAQEFGGDNQRIAAIGDSAGGNLVCAAALSLSNEIALKAQVLVYPPLDARMDSASYAEAADGGALPSATMKWFWETYCPDADLRHDPRASPVQATNLADLVPTLLIAAHHDPLRDEGEAFIDLLKASGVRAERRLFEQQFHGFFYAAGVIEEADIAMKHAAAFLLSHWRR